DRERGGRGRDDVPPAIQRRIDVVDLVAVDRIAFDVVLDDRVLLHADRDLGRLAVADFHEAHEVAVLRMGDAHGLRAHVQRGGAALRLHDRAVDVDRRAGDVEREVDLAHVPVGIEQADRGARRRVAVGLRAERECGRAQLLRGRDVGRAEVDDPGLAEPADLAGDDDLRADELAELGEAGRVAFARLELRLLRLFDRVGDLFGGYYLRTGQRAERRFDLGDELLRR